MSAKAPAVSRYKRYWAVRDGDGALICVCVYRRGAAEVVRRLSGITGDSATVCDVRNEANEYALMEGRETYNATNTT